MSTRLCRFGLIALTPIMIVDAGIAQDTGGRRLFVDFSQRLEGTTNIDEVPDGGDDAFVSTTRLNFGLSTSTPTRRLEFQAGTLLRKDFEDSDSETFEGPRVRLSFSERSRASSFVFNASYDSQDIKYLDALDLIDLLEEGEELPVDLEDLEDLSDEGTRDNLSFNSALAFGQDGPYGVTFRLSGQDVNYTNISPFSTLEDASRITASAAAFAEINPVLIGSVDLSYNRREEGEAANETTGLAFGLSYRRPITSYGVSLNLDAVDDDTRVGVSGSVSRTLRGDGRLAFSLGLTQTTGDELVWNGSARYSMALTPTSAFNTSFRRIVRDDPDEGETIDSVLTAGYSYQLNRLTQFGVNAQFLRTEDIATDNTETDARLSATVSRRLTEDWSLTGGVSSTLSESDDADRAVSNSVFLQIGRSFLTRF